MIKCCFAGLIVAMASPLLAVDYTWTGEIGNGKWRDAGNWSGGDGTAYPQGVEDTATFPASWVVELSDTPGNCGKVTIEEGAVVTASFSGTPYWYGLRGPGKFIQRSGSTLCLCNNATDGLCLYDRIVFQVEAGSVGFYSNAHSGTSIMATAGNDPTAGKAPTIGDATIIMKGTADLAGGGGDWPVLYGTLTVEVEEGLSSGRFLRNTLYSSLQSKIIKTGKGTLNFSSKMSRFAKGNIEIREGEIAFLQEADIFGEISGSGVLSATNLTVRGSNDLFTGTIALRKEGASALVYNPFGLVRANLEVGANSCNLSFDARDGRMYNPIAIPEGKSLTITSKSGGITHFYGLSGPGKVKLVTPDGKGGIYLYNRLGDKTGALDGDIQVDLTEKCRIANCKTRFNLDADHPTYGNATMTFASGAYVGNANGADWINVNGRFVVRTDVDDALIDGSYVLGSGQVVKEGAGLLTWKGCFGWNAGAPYSGDIIVKEGSLRILRNKLGLGYITGKVEGPGAIEYLSDRSDAHGARSDYFAGAVTAPLTCIFGKLRFGATAELNVDALTLGSNATVVIEAPHTPLRVRKSLTIIADDDGTKPVIQPGANALSKADKGSMPLIFSDTAFDADSFTYDLSGGTGWTIAAYGNRRVYARTTGAANVWTGVAGTLNWGDAANWADGVPSADDVVLYAGDFEEMHVPSKPNFSGKVYLRGAGEMVFSGAGLSDIAFDCSQFGGRFVKRGAETYLIPESCAPATFVVAEGIARKAARLSGGLNIMVEAGAQFDLSGNDHPGTQPTFTIAGAGPDGSGALVNTGGGLDNRYAQVNKLILSDDAAIGGTATWGLINNSYGELPLDLAGHTLTKVGENTILFANSMTK